MSYACIKRYLDVLGAACLLVVTLPLWALILIALALLQGRPFFYRQLRVGLHRRPFYLLKFRTMTDGTPRRRLDRPVVKDPDDPRVTPLGGLLRRSSLDELPQLLNILHGEMSLVGPRPLPKDDLDRPEWLTAGTPEECARRQEWLDRRHEVPPGLTGLWQITSNAAEDFENWLTCDLAYVASRSLALDLRILLRTPGAMLRGRDKVARSS